MIYLFNSTTNKILGQFSTIAIANDYLDSNGRIAGNEYTYLTRMDEMNNISRIVYVDGVCIYNNKAFWLYESNNIYIDYANHTVKDVLGNDITLFQFTQEMHDNIGRIQAVYDTASEVDYNIAIGFEFISLFREDCIVATVTGVTGLEVASATSQLIPLIMAGMFKEAAMVIDSIITNTFLTTELLGKYKAMLISADIITYNH